MEALWRRLLKARPRRVENRIAEELTKWSAKHGDHWVFKRWPAMGRTGPDIRFPNPYRFVVDVKSRKSISDKPWLITNLNREVKWWVRDEEMGGWYMCRLDQFDAMFRMNWLPYKWHSVVVDGWLEHMREWANEHSGIGIIILHKPKKPIGSSIVLIKTDDWLRLMEGVHLL